MTQLLPNVVAIEWRKNLAKLLVTSGIDAVDGSSTGT
jgi:hypothetical protein